MAQCPVAVKDALPQDRWQLHKLWSLDLATEQVAVVDLRWQLELPMWQYEGVRFQVRPIDVAAAPDRYPHHYARVMSADSSYPIHIIEHRGRLAVLDGFHRLLKAAMAGADSVTAMRLTRADLQSIVCR